MKNRRVKLSKKPSKTDELVYVELDTKCSCSSSTISADASIQFSRRYLECQGSMPIRILRLYIEQILPHSPTTQVSIYDSTDRLLSDSDRLKDLCSSSHSHLSLRFTLMNTITSLGHCVCSSSSSSLSSTIENDRTSFSSSSPSSSSPSSSLSSSTPTVIQRETINRTLSTCPLVPTPPHSPRSSISPIRHESPMPIVNLLTPPSPQHYSSFLIENLVESSSTDPSLIDQITSEFGEICPSVKPKRQKIVKKSLPKSFSSDYPLDLTIKKRPSSFDLFQTQSKWLKMI